MLTDTDSLSERQGAASDSESVDLAARIRRRDWSPPAKSERGVSRQADVGGAGGMAAEGRRSLDVSVRERERGRARERERERGPALYEKKEKKSMKYGDVEDEEVLVQTFWRTLEALETKRLETKHVRPH